MSESETPAVGIDLGTTYSVIAHLDSQGHPRTLANAEGDLITPSVLFFERDSVVVGKEAVKAAPLEPDCVAEFAKRDMGSATYGRPIRGRYFPPEVVQSFLLRKLKDDAELVLGPFSKVVITVPAYFNEPRRKATQDTARLAGLEAIDIINEPTAAAIAYGVQQGFLNEHGAAEKHEKLMVYDLGGGTFDVTLMQVDGADFTTLATAGDVYLGGIDWDRRIVDWLGQHLLERFGGQDPRQDDGAVHRLMREAEDIKRALSVRTEAQVKLEWHEQVWRGSLARVEFERLTADLVERTRFTMRNLLAEANLKWSDVTRLLLTGGSTRMPMILEMLRAESGLRVDRSLSADEAVAHGAAIYAGFLLRRDGASTVPQSLGKVVNVNSHHLGVLGYEPETGRPRCRVLIPRNTPLPTKRASRFATRRDDQRSVVVNVVEGGDASGHSATPIGKCVVCDLPPGLPANTPVRVVFNYAENGRLTVEADVPGADRRATLDIERASGLTPEMLDEWEAVLREGLHFDAADDQDEGQFVLTDEGGENESPGSDVWPDDAGVPPPLPAAVPDEETIPVDQAGTDTWDIGEPRREDDSPDDDLDDFLRQLR